MIVDVIRALQVVDPSKLSVKGHFPKEVAYKGIRDCFSKIFKEAGVKGLYRGVGMFSEPDDLVSKLSIVTNFLTFVILFQLPHSMESFRMLD